MERLEFFTIEKLGPKQSMTPEGFLLCEEVPIARTGMMIYGPDETPIDAGPDGLVKIFREEDEVFCPETVASAQGKPVTDDHPDEDVTPVTWKEKTVGIAMNVRRGVGAMDDLLLADLLITTEEGIELIQDGKREISCGYDADYEETAPGVGCQKNILINHIALVDQGRCGPRCAVSDHSPKEIAMPKYSRIADAVSKGVKDALRKGKARDEDEDLPPHAEPGDVHVHVHGGEVAPTPVGGAGVGDEGEDLSDMGSRERFTDDDIQEHMDRNEAEHAEMRERIEALEKLVAGKAGAGTGDEDEEGYGEGKVADNEEIEGTLKEEAPEGTSDEEIKMTKDSSLLVDSYKDTISLAEILVPGIRVPTFDRSAKPGQSVKKICGLRRQALDLAYNQPSTRSILDELLAGKTLNTKHMTCDAVRTLFRSAAALKKTVNNNAGRTGDMGIHAPAAGALSLNDVNKKNASYWANR